MPETRRPAATRNPDLGPEGRTSGWAGPLPLAVLFFAILAVIVGMILMVVA